MIEVFDVRFNEKRQSRRHLGVQTRRFFDRATAEEFCKGRSLGPRVASVEVKTILENEIEALNEWRNAAHLVAFVIDGPGLALEVWQSAAAAGIRTALRITNDQHHLAKAQEILLERIEETSNRASLIGLRSALRLLREARRRWARGPFEFTKAEAKEEADRVVDLCKEAVRR